MSGWLELYAPGAATSVLLARGYRIEAAQSATAAGHSAAAAQETLVLAQPAIIRARRYLDFGEFAPISDDRDADNAEKFKSWLEAASHDGLVATAGPGEWTISQASVFLQGDLDLRLTPQSVFIGAATTELMSAGQVITVDGGAGTRYALRVEGGRFDTSLRTYISGTGVASQGTAMSIRRLREYRYTSTHFYAGEDYLRGTGDSGVSINQCDFGLFDTCFFQGHLDKGIYITGGPSQASEDDDGDGHEVRGCTFYRCNTAASTTRQARGFRLINNRVIECRLGFRRAEAGVGAGMVGPGRDMYATGNRFLRIGGRAFGLHGPGDARERGGNDYIGGNTIVDWGYLFDGVTPAETRAIEVLGAVGAKIVNNSIVLDQWAPRDSMAAIFLSSRTFAATPPYTKFTRGTLVDGNFIRGCPGGVIESGSTTGSTGTNFYEDVSEPIRRAAGSGSSLSVGDMAGRLQLRPREIALGKADPNTIAGAGLGLNSLGELRATVQGNAPSRLNRLGSEGPVEVFYLDGTVAGQIEARADTGRAQWFGDLRLNSYSVAQLAEFAPTAGRVLYCNNGHNGARGLVMGTGTGWIRVDNGQAPSAEPVEGWRLEVVWAATVTLNFGTVAGGARQTITLAAPGVSAQHVGAVNAPGGFQQPNGIDLRIRCAADQVVVSANNTTASPIEVPQAGFRVVVLRAVAV